MVFHIDTLTRTDVWQNAIRGRRIIRTRLKYILLWYNLYREICENEAAGRISIEGPGRKKVLALRAVTHTPFLCVHQPLSKDGTEHLITIKPRPSPLQQWSMAAAAAPRVRLRARAKIFHSILRVHYYITLYAIKPGCFRVTY